MSRTYKTRPWWVRMNDSPAHARAAHDHRFGACDLAPLASVHLPGPAGRCQWERNWRLVPCGCPLCTGQFPRRTERRRDRHEARSRLRRYGSDD